MLLLLVGSFLISLTVSSIVEGVAPHAVVETGRWFVMMPYPWAGFIGVLLILLLWRVYPSLTKPLSLALGGSLANLVYYLVGGGWVADYIPIGFAVTNVADVFIVIGLVWAGFEAVKSGSTVRIR
jgi:lipoprotein signal peptidase